MKRIILSIVLMVLLADAVAAQPGIPPVGDVYSLLSGEHTPVIFTGSGTASSSAGYTTQWLQIGYSPEASNANNSNISRFNPEIFTLGMKLSLGSGADSTVVSTARFELSFDTTSTLYWNGDSSNIFIATNNDYRPDYGIWTFDPVSQSTRGVLFPLRLLQGGYIRLVFETTTSDEVDIEWTLTGEH